MEQVVLMDVIRGVGCWVLGLGSWVLGPGGGGLECWRVGVLGPRVGELERCGFTARACFVLCYTCNSERICAESESR